MRRKRAPKREVVMPEGSQEQNGMSRTSAFGFGAFQLPLTIVPSSQDPKDDLRFSVFFRTLCSFRCDKGMCIRESSLRIMV